MKSWLLADSPASRLQANLGQLYLLLRGFFRSPLAVIGFGIVCALLLCAAFAPWLATHDPYQQALTHRLLPPGAEHWFGTDHLGRDIWSRVIYGSRMTLLIIVMVAAIDRKSVV